MPDLNAMLNAHVEFELERWRGPGAAAEIHDEVVAAFKWLESVGLNDVVDRDRLSEVLSAALGAPGADGAASPLQTAFLHALREAALGDDTRLSDVVRKEDFDSVAAAVIGMREARAAVIEQLTSSEVYSSLIAHVLYQGIKSYLVSDGGFASRVPGASSLMRLGKGAVSAAAPNLEKTVDRQLTSFVNSNIQDSIRDSKTYLDSVLDTEILSAVADELWNSAADATLSDLTGVLSEESLSGLSTSGQEMWRHVSETEAIQDLAVRIANGLLDVVGDRPIAEILAESGVDPDRIVAWADVLAGPLLERALADGFLEAQIRSRLGAFYEQYEVG